MNASTARTSPPSTSSAPAATRVPPRRSVPLKSRWVPAAPNRVSEAAGDRILDAGERQAEAGPERRSKHDGHGEAPPK